MSETLKFLQAASNAVAGNVAGPVDLITAALNKLGLNVQKPVGGSEWMRQTGLMADVPQGAAQVAGETVGLLAPTMAVAKAPQIAKGLLQMGDNLAAPRTLHPETGAIVWHGSPHKFDKFDSSKIGTGEGAQAYGHGLYLAESPDVAKSYQASTTKGFNLPDGQDVQGVANVIALRGEETARKVYANLGNRLDDVILQAKQAINDGSSLYKVDLPDDAIAKMLDWDKPLSQQPPEVQALIKKTKGMLPSNAMDDLGGDLSLLYGPDLTGADFLGTMNSLQPNFGETALQRVGVPGVRYLDGGSRGAGSGTSNFVVFPGNEGLLTILERNGQALR